MTLSLMNETRTRRTLNNPLVGFLIPAAFVAAFFLLLIDLGCWIFFRNYFRAISGPLIHVVQYFQLEINVLKPHLLLAASFWFVWVVLVLITPLRKAPFWFHLTFCSLWIGYGCTATLAI